MGVMERWARSEGRRFHGGAGVSMDSVHACQNIVRFYRKTTTTTSSLKNKLKLWATVYTANPLDVANVFKSATAGEGGSVAPTFPLVCFGSVCVSKARCVLLHGTGTNNYQLLGEAACSPRLLVFINNPVTLWFSDVPLVTADQQRSCEGSFSTPNDPFCQ